MKKYLHFLTFLVLVGFVQLNAQDVNVTFQVDMSVQIANNNFDVSNDVVTIPGGFNNWLNEPPANSEKTMEDADEDGIYTKTIAMAPSAAYEYKYNIGLGWDGKDETTGNRTVFIGTADTTIEVQWFNMQAATGIASSVTFNVDMRLQEEGDFDRTTNNVFVGGSFTDWQNGAIIMTDEDGDSVFTVTVSDSITSGELIKFKFIWSPGDTVDGGAAAWETRADREYFVLDSNNVVTAFWDDVDPDASTLVDGNIFFEIDMSVANELGVFDPTVDSVQIRGSFNGWGDSEPTRSKLIRDAINPLAWYLDVSFSQYQIGSQLAYKYFIKNPEGNTQFSNTGWEVHIGPTTDTDRNRRTVFEGSATQEAPIAYFGHIHPDWVIPEGTSVEAEFSVDMTYATLADSQGTNPVFDAAADTVYWIPRQPLYYAVHGLEWTTDQRVLIMTDPDQDMVYTGTLSLDGPAFNGFLYNYAFVKNGTTTFVQEDGGQGGARVRFIGQSAARTFTSPWNMPLDEWSNSDKPEETDPFSVVSVKSIDLVANKFALDQNYPNPFNPTTQIRFSIPQSNIVTLKIYSLLGQEIKTLINEDMQPGSYEINFNGSELSSGLYFYILTSGDFVSTKKMMLLK